MVYKAADFGITACNEVGVKLNELLKSLADVEGEKTLVFDKGEYYIDSETCPKKLLYITNTIGDKEWKPSETPHLNEVGIYFENIKDLTVQGNGCKFIMRGQMTNVAISKCENLVLSDFAIATENPDVHELEAIKKGLFSIDFKLDNESSYVKQSGQFYFKGKGYKVPFLDSCIKAHWIGKVNKNVPNRVKRVGHPLFGAYKIKEIGNNLFRAYYTLPRNFCVGDCFYLFDVRRKYVGIFAEQCQNLKLNEINQHFNYSLALVCQDCENIEMSNCNFAPIKNSAKRIASLADFIQICMCRGDVNIHDNNFVGAGDDCLNAHGIHFKIFNVLKNKIVVGFCHPQSHGFNPLRVGDTIKFVNPNTLAGDKKAKILSSKLLDEYNIELEITSVDGAVVGEVIEDISACPNLNFSNNSMSRIITRGILVTTSGKVEIKNNSFIDTYMNSILISDDAKSWYESGNVENVIISGNTFMECNGYNVCIKPENGSNKNYVHSNIVISNNVMSSKRGGVFIKCADKVVLKSNKNLKRTKIINSQVKFDEGVL